MKAPEKYVTDGITVEDSWGWSVTDALGRSRRTAWIIACVSAAIAFILAVAVVIMLPLKQSVPYTILVDRQTGHVEALDPFEAATIVPDTALTRSMLVQYVVARESFDADSFARDYRKVALWTDGTERRRYVGEMQPNSPASPLAYMPRGGTIATDVLSVTSLTRDSALVRFVTTRSGSNGAGATRERWAAVVNFHFSTAPMSGSDRLINPLGFQVTRYRRSEEDLPEELPALQQQANAYASEDRP